ncbi:MAG TPA: ABC transporter permease subunit [Anaerolineales bacterium]|nr:ABC transporter permease subunit [Anaerolineales bacterium]
MTSGKPSLWKSIKVGLNALAVMVVFAYGFQITKVNLAELRSEQRRESLVRVVRALARPDIFEYEQEEQVFNAPVYVPCPTDGSLPAVPPQETSGPYVQVSPTCAEPGETVTVEGFNFFPNAEGPLRFVPGSDPSSPLMLGNDTVKTDGEGHFIATFQLPDRPSNEVQYIRTIVRRNVGIPRLTQTAYDTWDKIVETVFLALLATALGTVLAVPLSFIAARNLMKTVRSPLASISLSTMGWVIGIVLGYGLVRWIAALSAPFASSVPVNLAGVILSPAVMWVAFRWSMPQVEVKPPTLSLRMARILVILIAVFVGFYGLFQLAALVGNIGTFLSASLGAFGFIGNFLFQVSDILRVSTPALGALAAGGTVSSLFGRLGQYSTEKLSAGSIKLLNMILAAAAGATVMGLLGLVVEWLYQIGRPEYTLWGAMGFGAAFGFLLAAFTRAKETLAIGMVIYYITRTILNTLRSVEALVMAIVFVIAVGIGPFAGVMALGLHTIVSLAKLYSEQVESILPGPLEAIQATGANRLQTIIYAVVPQIIPPYISYTMYRWDINVRMSTIIGFVGGGGIGFLLQQNINLLNYRAASAQMLAIAVVVATMDYISSVLREKYV